MSGPSFMGYINSLVGIRTIYIIVFVVAMLMLIQTLSKEEPLRVGTGDHASSSTSQADSREPRLSGDKED